MKTKFFKEVTKFLKDDLSMAFSITYIVLIAIGMLFNAFYYLFFRINIVEYSDISDFLLAPFRDPVILIFVIGTIVFVYYFNVFDDWFERKSPKLYSMFYFGLDKEKYLEWYNIKGMTFVIVSYVFIAAGFYGKRKAFVLMDKTATNVNIILKDNKFEPTDTLLYVGKTNSYVFLYNKGKKQTDVIPLSDVLRLEVNRRK